MKIIKIAIRSIHGYGYPTYIITGYYDKPNSCIWKIKDNFGNNWCDSVYKRYCSMHINTQTIQTAAHFIDKDIFILTK